MNHAFKSSFGQCQCRWCGRRKGTDCPVTTDIRERVADFAKNHGRTWKAALRRLWTSGQDEGLLRQARNTIGPNRIDGITKHMLDRVAYFKAKRVREAAERTNEPVNEDDCVD